MSQRSDSFCRQGGIPVLSGDLMKPYHFYVAFNPLFNEERTWKTQAHEFHHLLKEKKAKAADAHMYWGKIQISEHSEVLNIENFETVLKDNAELQLDTHIYITDYQNLWVGKVTQVLREIPDPENTLKFYHNKKVEAWFKIIDFDLLSHHANETLALLNKLHVDNEFYHYKVKEVAPFTSGIRFPMIVQDRSQERFFSSPSHGPALRVMRENPMLASSGDGIKLIDYIQSFVIPEENFGLIPEGVRSQVIQAEILLLEAQTQNKKDRIKLEQGILTYLKCLEILLNETFVDHLKREEGHRIYVTKDDSTPRFIRSVLDKDKRAFIRLKDCNTYFNLSQIKMLLDTPSFFPHTSLDYIFRKRKIFWEYCRLELRATLKNESLIELRNLLSIHGNVMSHDRELFLVRNILLGVGGKGVFNGLVETYFELNATKFKTA